MSVEDELRSLTLTELKILRWKCMGYSYLRMSSPAGEGKIRLGPDSIQKYMSRVYRKFGFTKDMHHSQRKRILQEKYCPVLLEIFPTSKALQDNYEEFKAQREDAEDIVEPEVTAEMLALVLFDEQMEEEEKAKPPSEIERFEPIQIVPPPLPRPDRLPWLLVAIIVVLVIALALFAYRFFTREPELITVRETVEVPVTMVSTPERHTEEPVIEPELPPTADLNATGAAIAATTVAEQPSPDHRATETQMAADVIAQLTAQAPPSTDTPAPTSTPQPPPNFSDDFNLAIKDEWGADPAEWRSIDGQLRSLVPDAWLEIGDSDWSNYSVSVDINLIPSFWSDGNGNRCEVRVLIRGESYLALNISDWSDHWKQDGNELPGTEFTAPPIPFTARIDVEGSLITTYMDGREVFEFPFDAGIDHGRVGLFCAVEGSVLDNFVVTPIDASQ